MRHFVVVLPSNEFTVECHHMAEAASLQSMTHEGECEFPGNPILQESPAGRTLQICMPKNFQEKYGTSGLAAGRVHFAARSVVHIPLLPRVGTTLITSSN
jgi:hypothetical protein